MTEEITNRSMLARIGVTALNLLAPGVGLLRVGSGRAATLILVIPTLTLLATAALFAIAPTLDFVAILTVVAMLVVVVIATMIVSMVMTWRRSAMIATDRPWWSRWYGLALAVVIQAIVSPQATSLCHRFYKPFYMPAESMAPLLVTNDKIVADMHGGRHPARGDIILVDDGHARIYVKRVAALAGDRIAMADGVPVINGVPARQTSKGSIRYQDYQGPVPALLIDETLPGETGSHQIIDLGWVPEFDDMNERTVPAGHIFVLGDNRDRSADSRVPKAMNGLEMVPMGHIVGRPLFVTWSADRSKIGRNVTH